MFQHVTEHLSEIKIKHEELISKIFLNCKDKYILKSDSDWRIDVYCLGVIYHSSRNPV